MAIEILAFIPGSPVPLRAFCQVAALACRNKIGAEAAATPATGPDMVQGKQQLLPLVVTTSAAVSAASPGFFNGLSKSFSGGYWRSFYELKEKSFPVLGRHGSDSVVLEP